MDELGLQGPLADAHYVSVASPIFWNDADVFSFGYQNDPAYGLADDVNSPDVTNIYWYDDEVYVIDGQNYYPAHDLDNIAEGLERIIASDMFGAVVDLESPIVIDGVNGATFVGTLCAGRRACLLPRRRPLVREGRQPAGLARMTSSSGGTPSTISTGWEAATRSPGSAAPTDLYGGDAADRLWGGTGAGRAVGRRRRRRDERRARRRRNSSSTRSTTAATSSWTFTPLPPRRCRVRRIRSRSARRFSAANPGDAVVVSGYRLPDSGRPAGNRILLGAHGGSRLRSRRAGPQDGTLIVTLEDGPRILQADDILLF